MGIYYFGFIVKYKCLMLRRYDAIIKRNNLFVFFLN
jgi:hypothetical protein